MRKKQHHRMASSSTYSLLRTTDESCGSWVDERPTARSVLAERDLGALVDVVLADGEPETAWQVAVANPDWDPSEHRWMRLAEAREASVPGDAFEIYLRLADLELEETGRTAYTRAVAILKKAARAANAAVRKDEFAEHVASLGDEARLTKDLDLGLRSEVESGTALHELLIEALSVDREGDRFEFAAAAPQLLASDGAGHPTWRVSVAARLAGRNFGGIRLDVSPRPHELVETEEVVLPNTLDFAGIPATTIEMVDVNRHTAEKLHAMSRDFGDRENIRVRDLMDVVLLIEHGLLTTERLRACVREVWTERDRTDPPTELPAFPSSWPMRYELLTIEHGVGASDFPSARAQIERLWSDLR